MDKNPNINKRVSIETKEKIEELMKNNNLSANDLFKEMISLYENNKDKDMLPDYSKDIDELSIALECISSTYANIINKTKLHLANKNEEFALAKENIKLDVEIQFKESAERLLKEKNQAVSEYNSIFNETEMLIEESKNLRNNISLLEDELTKSRDLNSTYKEQIASLQDTNKMLSEKISSQSSVTDIENIKREHSMELLSAQIKYQDNINKIKDEKQKEIDELKEKLACEKDKYTELNNLYMELKFKK